MGIIKVIKDFVEFFSPPKIDYEKIMREIPKPPPYIPVTSGHYLLTLTDSKDMYLAIVNHEVWNWIMDKNYPTPKSIQKMLTEQPLNYNEPNDRALYAATVDDSALSTEILGTFWSASEMANFVKTNSIQISDEFKGYIY